MKKPVRGFTLIELLITISIIAILAAVGLVVYSTAQKQGRISKRVQDLKAISLALETYHTAIGSYPVVSTGSGWSSECQSWGSQPSANVIPGLVPTYMPAFPSDPSMNAANSWACYIYVSPSGAGGSDYKLLDDNIPEFSNADYLRQPQLVDPARDGGVTSTSCGGSGGKIVAWAVYTPGARCW